MPYIDYEQRVLIDAGDEKPESAGELNYAITKLLVAYVSTNKQRYQTFNDALGALEGAKQEFYRRVVVPYEEQKRFENGDVYDV